MRKWSFCTTKLQVDEWQYTLENIHLPRFSWCYHVIISLLFGFLLMMCYHVTLSSLLLNTPIYLYHKNICSFNHCFHLMFSMLSVIYDGKQTLCQRFLLLLKSLPINRESSEKMTAFKSSIYYVIFIKKGLCNYIGNQENCYLFHKAHALSSEWAVSTIIIVM